MVVTKAVATKGILPALGFEFRYFDWWNNSDAQVRNEDVVFKAPQFDDWYDLTEENIKVIHREVNHQYPVTHLELIDMIDLELEESAYID